MNFRDVACPTLGLTRLSKRSGTSRGEFAQKLRTPVRPAEVSHRALALETIRLVVRQFLKWPAEVFPRGTPSMAMAKTFPTCCPPRKLSARTGKLPVCPCTAIVFQRSDLRLVPRRLNNFPNLLPSSTATCTGVSASQNDLFVSRASPYFPLSSLCWSGDHQFYRLLDFPRRSMSFVCYSCPLSPNGNSFGLLL